ncbi:hypothetical protein PG993_008374 [Apiospora rasikravindrae]|uniref:Uncharacterized protein n=1 Tax=Apiospora rasikravindrae TaxID=990691 RepID=A0ABR1T2I8_9PEZI
MPSLHSNREVHSDGTTTNTTTDGSTVRTDDASARPDAGLGQKLAGDAKGGVAKATGSLQAAAGAATNNEKMKQQGLDKMQAEDQRLAAKHGVMPLGSGLREKASGQPTAEQIPATTAGTHTHHDNTAATAGNPTTANAANTTTAAGTTNVPASHGGVHEGGHAAGNPAREQV